MPLNNDAINEILPYAQNPVTGDEVESLEQYKTDDARIHGAKSGLNKIKTQNKLNKQVSHMAAGTAQFLANRHAVGIKDDGDLDKIEDAWSDTIVKMITDNAPAPNLSGYVPVDRTVTVSSPLTGGGSLDNNITISVGDASSTTTGVVQLTTDAEAQAGTITTKALTPAALTAATATTATASRLVKTDATGKINTNFLPVVTSTTTFKSGGNTTTTGFQIASGADLSTIFTKAASTLTGVENVTSGTNTFVTSASLSVVSGKIRLTTLKGTNCNCTDGSS